MTERKAILNLELKNFRKSNRNWATAQHAECDVFLDGNFITSYTWNPFFFAKMDFKNVKTYMRSFSYKKTFDRDDFLKNVFDSFIIKYGTKAEEIWDLWTGRKLFKYNKKLTKETYDSVTKKVWENVLPVYPDPYDVESGLVSDAKCVEGYTFEEFCDNLGYSSDSIKAVQVYADCQRILNLLVRTEKYLELCELHADD